MLQQSTGYAIRAVSCLDGPNGDYMLVRDVANRAGVPPAFLAKIIAKLRKKGVVTAQRGVGGGVRLAKRPEAVTFFDVCQAMEDPILDASCMLGLPACGNAVPCSGHVKWAEAKAKVISTLEALTLKGVAPEEISSPDAEHAPRREVEPTSLHADEASRDPEEERDLRWRS